MQVRFFGDGTKIPNPAPHYSFPKLSRQHANQLPLPNYIVTVCKSFWFTAKNVSFVIFSLKFKHLIIESLLSHKCLVRSALFNLAVPYNIDVVGVDHIG